MRQHKRYYCRPSLKECNDKGCDGYLHNEAIDERHDSYAARVPDVSAPVRPFWAGLSDPVSGVGVAAAVEFVLESVAGLVGGGTPGKISKTREITRFCGCDNTDRKLKK